MAVSGALRAGRGGSEPCAQRSAGGWAAVRPSTGSGWLWGVGSLVNKKLGGTACATPPYKARGLFCGK